MARKCILKNAVFARKRDITGELRAGLDKNAGRRGLRWGRCPQTPARGDDSLWTPQLGVVISIESEKRAKANVALGPPVREEHAGAARGYGGALPESTPGLLAPDPRQGE